MADASSFVSEAKSYARGARYFAHKALFSAKNLAGLAKIQAPSLGNGKPEKIRRVLMPMLRHEYGRKEWGDSLEFLTFYPCMKNVADADFFDFKAYIQEHGRRAMNDYLLSIAKKGEYDLMFFSLMINDFDWRIIRQISDETPTLALNWFSDDQWRFESFSSRWAGAFNFCATTCRNAPVRYAALGYPYAIRTQFAANPLECMGAKRGGEELDACFVGQKHGGRERLIASLKKAGISVKTFGTGWPSGRVGREKMLSLFAGAKISLSPAESSFYFAPLQMKARVFEVPACGGFQLAGNVPELSDYFEFEKEIATYSSFGELVQKIKYYLHNEDERKKIAMAGRKRCLEEHTYEKRYSALFAEIGRMIGQAKRQ